MPSEPHAYTYFGLMREGKKNPCGAWNSRTRLHFPRGKRRTVHGFYVPTGIDDAYEAQRHTNFEGLPHCREGLRQSHCARLPISGHDGHHGQRNNPQLSRDSQCAPAWVTPADLIPTPCRGSRFTVGFLLQHPQKQCQYTLLCVLIDVLCTFFGSTVHTLHP